MSVILGINANHADSAACVVIDGELKAAVAEERLGNRVKHDSSFPKNAIRKVLSDAKVVAKDVTHLAIARDPRANLAAKIIYSSLHPIKSSGAVLEHFRRRKSEMDVCKRISDVCGVAEDSFRPIIVNVEHHLAHIASSYYLSPFDSAAGLTYDGSGDFVSLLAAKCEGNNIRILDKVYLPDSPGFFYTALCQFIGFDQFGEEYKVMGLAPYGEDRFRDEMAKLLMLDSSGWFHLAKGFFGMHEGGISGETDENGYLTMGRFYTDNLIKLLGKPRSRGNEITQREKDIARSCQVRFEEMSIHCLSRLWKITQNENLCMAGGCALNGVANARILRDTPFKVPYLQAAASDDGTCLGAAFWCYHNVVGGNKRYEMKHAFWGPEYSERDIEEAISNRGLNPTRCANEDETIEKVAHLIHEGKVVGWYQGRSEWGPRALGNRSILANPAILTMKDTINKKIKRRESFRPFAPSVLKESVGDYFEQDIDSPFMMHVVKLREKWRSRLPAITHVDGTGRLQTVDKDNNYKYHKLIKKFQDLSGVGVVLNTSFNENEPVVDTPDQALDCFLRTGMDALCLKDSILLKDMI
ncbi:MAG TPA: carbamoyltransferase C-terminal domain-containing protein [Paludibacter sp.]|nr:carbamoyltransferase C-terminal domain-containing protein [Paludibacter sp.]